MKHCVRIARKVLVFGAQSSPPDAPPGKPTGIKCFFSVFAAALVLLCLAACGNKKHDPVSGQETVFSGSHVSLGKSAAGLSAYRIAYFEPAALQGTAADNANIIEESGEPFVIADYGPSGELPAEIKKPAIYVVFSQPVVPLAKLGEPIRESAGLFTIEPPLTGTYRWYGSRLLSFEPDAESFPQRRYTVTLSDRIKSLGGKTLEGENSFSFETERLEISDWNPGTGEYWVDARNTSPADAKYVSIYFSHPVNLDEIAKWIEIRAGEKTMPFTLSRHPVNKDGGTESESSFGNINRSFSPEQAVLLEIKEPLPLDTDVNLVLLEGARSEPGWLGTREEKSFSFHTLLPFAFRSVSVRSASRPRTGEGDTIPIMLEFSQEVDPDNDPSLFSIEGMPAIKKENFNVYGATVVLNGLPLEYRKTYSVKISGGLKDLWGRRLESDLSVEAQTGEANSYAYFLNQGSKMLEAQFPPKIVWETQNPLSIRSLITDASGPYEQVPLAGLNALDISALPKNSKKFFVEDLAPFMGPGGKGSAAMRWEYQTLSQWRPGTISKSNTWLTVQVTDIGLTVRYAYNMVLVWATRLSTGEPLVDAKTELLEGETTVLEGTTDSSGLAVFRFEDGEFVSRFSAPSQKVENGRAGKGFRIRVSENGGAEAGGDQAEFIPNDSHNIWRFDVDAAATPFTAEKERPVIFLFTDRGLYRPGETVTFRGIDRILSRGKYGVSPGPYTVRVSSILNGGQEIAAIKGNTTTNGGSFGSFKLPDVLDPGQYALRYTRDTDSTREAQTRAIYFTVANFERLRFEASLKFPDIPVYSGDKISGRLSASYLQGGSLTGAPYTYYWTRETTDFNPGGKWKDWRFGPETYDGRYYAGEGEGNLGPDGSADISQLAAADGTEGAVYNYRLEASVQDAARQEISARGGVTVHPASFYIASRLDSGTFSGANIEAADPPAGFLESGSPAAISWAIVSPGGTPWENEPEINIQIIRYDWKQSRQQGTGGRINLNWERVEEIKEEITITPEEGKHSGGFSFTPEQSGQWEVRLRALDEKGRTAFTRYGFYVSGSGWARWGFSDTDSITLNPDRPLYAPGDTAKIMIRSPLPEGRYLLTLEREGIISEKIIELDGSARTIDIPIDESYVPVVYAALSSFTVRSGPPSHNYYEPDLDKPKGIFGLAAIHVDNSTRHYKIEIEPEKGVYGPAEEASVTLKVTLNGRPAPGVELCFMAVDRGVVDLIGYHVPDPLAYFYNPRNFPIGVKGADSRSLLIDPVTYALTDLQGGDDKDGSEIEERKDFRPTAVFEPYLISGPDGTVNVKFNLPDSLTTYRCTAVAAGIENFGISEKDLQVSAPLSAAVVLPRKLRWRDTGTVSLLLTNLEKESVEANVSLEIENISPGETGSPVVELDGGGGEKERKITIEGGASAECTFRVAAAGSGEARLIFTLNSPKVNERIIKTLSVDRPVLYETVTAAGSIGNGGSFIEEGVALPSLVPEGTGSLSVSLSASRLAMLGEAVRYLFDYPYGCLEQKTARLLPLVAFGDRLETFGLESVITNPEKIIEDELSIMAGSQLPDGSFPYWPGGRRGDIFVSLRVAHIFALAGQKGYAVPQNADRPKLLAYIAAQYNSPMLENDPFLKGYSLWIRAMYGEKTGVEISSFLKRGDELGISGWSFAGLAANELEMKDLALSTRDRIRRYIRPGTRTLDLTDTYETRGGYWGFETDRYALALMLYEAVSPDDEMTARLAAALVERRRRGVWTNTASSFWAVLAFGRAADAEDREGVNFISRASLGGAPLKEAAFRSYGGRPVSQTWLFSDPPVDSLERDAILPLRIERDGSAGSLYYTASLRYGIPAELASARDEGIGVFAETFDAEGRKVEDGALIAGKTYTRKLVVSSSRDRGFMALRAPVPSGAEIIDAAFVTSSTVPPPEGKTGTDETLRYEYEDPPVRFIMDDEIRFHWDFFPSGKKEVEFRFRAVMPGVYPLPPSSAECMYEPEIFGRSPGELIRIIKEE